MIRSEHTANLALASKDASLNIGRDFTKPAPNRIRRATSLRERIASVIRGWYQVNL
jgi:hypothetical protein